MNMKQIRLIVVIWIIVFGLLLSGCGAGLTLSSAPTQATTGIATKTPRPAPTATKPAVSQQVTIESDALAKNMIGEKTERTILVYLPPAYDASTKRYPVVYFLPGFGDRSMDTSSEDINKLIQGGTIQEMIIVVVPGDNRLGGSFYVNSPVTGHWEDFVYMLLGMWTITIAPSHCLGHAASADIPWVGSVRSTLPCSIPMCSGPSTV
jgi:hypothetical protein